MVLKTSILGVIMVMVRNGGPVTWERGIFRQNTFCNISLYIQPAHKANERIFKFHFSAFMKWLAHRDDQFLTMCIIHNTLHTTNCTQQTAHCTPDAQNCTLHTSSVPNFCGRLCLIKIRPKEDYFCTGLISCSRDQASWLNSRFSSNKG